jgi:hypothetical protein
VEKKVQEESSMGPRELARCAVVDMYEVFAKANGMSTEGIKELWKQLINLRYSTYREHLQKMSSDEYIQYLEQVLKEIDYFQYKRQIKDSIAICEMQIWLAKWDEKGRKEIVKSKYQLEYEKRLRELERINAEMYDMFINSKYVNKACIYDQLTKGFWENDNVQSKRINR